MRASAHPNALRVAAALGANFTVVEFDESTHTAQEAADAIGCSLAQIAKSILFRSASGKPVMVIASGVNRVDEKKVKAYPTVWAAGGTPNAVFEIGFAQLSEMSGATVADIAKR